MIAPIVSADILSMTLTQDIVELQCHHFFNHSTKKLLISLCPTNF